MSPKALPADSRAGRPRPAEYAHRRWENPTRWYEALIVLDLLGDWTVVRRWGGRGSRLGNQLIEVVDDYPTAVTRVDKIDAQRRRRKVPYCRVSG